LLLAALRWLRAHYCFRSPRRVRQLGDQEVSQSRDFRWTCASRRDVQAISAGAGIRHSEHNLGTEPLRLFQIWLRPRVNGGEPYWNTRRFPKHDRANQFVVLASGFPGDSDALPILADAKVLGATLRAGTQVQHELGDFRYAYLAPARGAVAVNGLRLAVGDGIAALDELHLTIFAEEDSEVILVVTD
jgi:redox-sensitive bicupin YhaK (pirin superfamily)